MACLVQLLPSCNLGSWRTPGGSRPAPGQHGYAGLRKYIPSVLKIKARSIHINCLTIHSYKSQKEPHVGACIYVHKTAYVYYFYNTIDRPRWQQHTELFI